MGVDSGRTCGHFGKPVGVLTPRSNLVLKLICRRIVADGAVKIHHAGMP
jgi:hypothetical protein